MNVVGIMIIVPLILATVLGFIIGLCKGFHRVKTWGVDYLLATLITVALSGAIGGAFNKDNQGLGAHGVVSLIIGIVMILVFSMISAIIKKAFLSSKRAKIARGGKRKGPAGFFDSIFGGVTLAAKGFVIMGALSAFGLVVADLAQIPALTESLGDIYVKGSWTAFKPLLMDFFCMGVIMAAIRSGFKSGISSVLWACCVIGMVAGSVYIAYHLAFEVESFQGAASSLSSVFGGNEMVGKLALAGGIFVMMLVVVILIGVFVPKLLASARNGSAFYVIDGIFGALFSLILIVGILLFFGSFLQPISDGEEFVFMAKFSSYFEASKFATFFYDKNIMVMYGMQPLLPVADWFKPAN